MGEPSHEFEPEPWGEDAKLVDALGEQGAAGFRALLDGFPEPVGVLWALRDGGGAIVDFTFGYGNPTMLRGFRIPAETPDRYTLLEALPPMRGSQAFEAYAHVCETGTPFVNEVTYDTPFGDGYMLGSFVHRVAQLGDGVVVFLHDVTEERRMEAELKAYADVVAHDLSQPLAGIAMLVTMLEQRPEEPPPAVVLQELRASTDRGRELIEGVLSYARSGELTRERVSLNDVLVEVASDLRTSIDDAGAVLVVDELPTVSGDPRQLRRVLQNLVGNALKFRGDEPPRIEIGAERRGARVGRDGARQRHRHRPRGLRQGLRHVLASRAERRGQRNRAGRLPAGGRGPRRAHVGRARRRRGERLPVHAARRAGLTTRRAPRSGGRRAGTSDPRPSGCAP